MPLFFVGTRLDPHRLVLTFDNLVRNSDFVPTLKNVLAILARHYRAPVDVEFAITLAQDAGRPSLAFHLLQCRPQSSMKGQAVQPVPTGLPEDDQLFLASRMVPQGQVNRVEYVVYIDPMAYKSISDPSRRQDIARVVGRLNKALEDCNFILLGPGRWGSANSELGVPVGYADIFNARALVELAFRQQGITPEPSYGTHFFQDLVEARIYPLAIYPDESGDALNRDFIAQAQNHLAEVLPGDADLAQYVKVIHVPREREGCYLEIAMDGAQALAYFWDRDRPRESESSARRQMADEEPENPFYGW